MHCPAAGGGWGNGEGKVGYTVYFHMEFSKPLEQSRSVDWQLQYQELVRRAEVPDRCREQEGNPQRRSPAAGEHVAYLIYSRPLIFTMLFNRHCSGIGLRQDSCVDPFTHET
jgi:hypothetical protein